MQRRQFFASLAAPFIAPQKILPDDQLARDRHIIRCMMLLGKRPAGIKQDEINACLNGMMEVLDRKPSLSDYVKRLKST